MNFTTAAPLTCAGSTIYNSILRAGEPEGSILAIFGLGGLGHLGVQSAKTMGSKVVAVETRQPPIDLVNSLPDRFRLDLILNPLENNKDFALKKSPKISRCNRGGMQHWSRPMLFPRLNGPRAFL